MINNSNLVINNKNLKSNNIFKDIFKRKEVVRIKNFFKNIFGKFKGKLSDKPLIGKIFYTIILIAVFRMAATITIPGVEVNSLFANSTDSFSGIMNLIGGGGLSNFSIVALGIGPYITSSIVMTLLQSEVFPAFYRLSKSGPAGKKKINIITRMVTIVFAIVQAITIIQQFKTGQLVVLQESLNGSIWYQYIVIPFILLAGTLFTLFLGEQITSKGVGNGTSLIIFSGVAAKMPNKIKSSFSYFTSSGEEGSNTLIGVMDFILYMFVFFIILYVAAYFYKSERHIPIQQMGSGLTQDVDQMSRLPIKLNPAGVMPIIFAFTITLLPLTIVQFLHHQNLGRIWVEHNMQLTKPLGLSIFILVIFLFSIVMSLVTFNTYTIAENFQKQGTFIPGVRPGEETERYLTGVVIRLSMFSAIYLSIISSLQFFEQIIGITKGITISGTSLIILVSVAIETLDQLKARDTTQNIARAKIRAVKHVESGSEDVEEGLLW